jgi:hypothetical protein
MEHLPIEFLHGIARSSRAGASALNERCIASPTTIINLLPYERRQSDIAGVRRRSENSSAVTSASVRHHQRFRGYAGAVRLQRAGATQPARFDERGSPGNEVLISQRRETSSDPRLPCGFHSDDVLNQLFRSSKGRKRTHEEKI